MTTYAEGQTIVLSPTDEALFSAFERRAKKVLEQWFLMWLEENQPTLFADFRQAMPMSPGSMEQLEASLAQEKIYLSTGGTGNHPKGSVWINFWNQVRSGETADNEEFFVWYFLKNDLVCRDGIDEISAGLLRGRLGQAMKEYLEYNPWPRRRRT